MKRTKIIATLGPASNSATILKKMVSRGMNVARLNFSHGTHESHGELINLVRQTTPEIGILLDTKGPEIRTGDFESEAYIEEGAAVTILNKDVSGSASCFSINYKELHKDIAPGQKILIDDGRIELVAESVEGEDIICRAITSGKISSGRGVNVPGCDLKLPGLSKKDIEDIKLGASMGVDYIAASFVRSPRDIISLRLLLSEIGAQNVGIVAKIETAQAIKSLEEIIKVSDGVMVARGDLAVEVDFKKVPLLQKKIVDMANEYGKYCIVATEMLHSMVASPRPTRAEISDVANAVFSGTDCVMLSGETASGKYPVESVHVMAQIAAESESVGREEKQKLLGVPTAPDMIARYAFDAAKEAGIRKIVIPTRTGFSAKLVSRHRPTAKIYALVPNEEVLRKMAPLYGIEGVLTGHFESFIEGVRRGARLLIETGKLKEDEDVLVTGAYRSELTNSLIIAKAGRLCMGCILGKDYNLDYIIL